MTTDDPHAGDTADVVVLVSADGVPVAVRAAAAAHSGAVSALLAEKLGERRRARDAWR